MDLDRVTSILLADGWHKVERGVERVDDPLGLTDSKSTYLPSWFLAYDPEADLMLTGPLSSILAYRYPGRLT